MLDSCLRFAGHFVLAIALCFAEIFCAGHFSFFDTFFFSLHFDCGGNAALYDTPLSWISGAGYVCQNNRATEHVERIGDPFFNEKLAPILN